MNSKRNYWQSGAVALMMVLGLILAPAAGAAQTSRFTIIPPHSAKAQSRMSYAQWSAVWWQWALSLNATGNPLPDPTGARCGAGQSRGGPVFFLVGAFGNGAITRDACVVPAGKLLFFPLVNAIDFHTPGDGLDTPELTRQDLLKYFGPITELHAGIDGEAVGNLNPVTTPYRACAGGDPTCSPAFNVTLPADNFWSIPAGVYYPAVADGYYLMLAPLRPGPHTITFGGTGTYAGGPLVQDITYHLIVK